MSDNNFKGSGVFALDGVTGMLIATVLLLSILVGLTIWDINVQKANQVTFYKLVNQKTIPEFSNKEDNAESHRVIVETVK
jgi:hypothetical protein